MAGTAKEWWNDLRVGDGHAGGMARAGLKELAAALPAFPDHQRVVEEPGVFGNPTQGEVARARVGASLGAEPPGAEAGGRTSVLGYPLPEPPRPDQQPDQSRGR